MPRLIGIAAVRKVFLVGLALGAVVLLAGCSGHTTGATNITTSSARLNAIGSCDNGNCSAFMRWRPVGTSAWTNGPTINGIGKVSNVSWNQTASGLTAGTQYEYQTCGKEASWSTFVCVGPDGHSTTTEKFTTAGSKTCNETLTGSYSSIVVPQNGTCTLNGARATGDVTVNSNAYFEANGTSIGGTVSATGAVTVFIHDGSSVGGSVSTSGTPQLFLFGSTVGNNVTTLSSIRNFGVVDVCGMRINGALVVQERGQDILLGHADPTAGCAGNTVGAAYVLRNSTSIELVVSANNVTGDLRVNRNQGTSGKSVDHNTGGIALVCNSNQLPFIGSPNFGFATKSGQCS
jgi:hypothetical protein